MTSFPVKTASNDARVIWGLLALVLGSWLLVVAVVGLLLGAVGLALGWPGHVLEMSGAIGVAGGVLVGLAWWGADHG